MPKTLSSRLVVPAAALFVAIAAAATALGDPQSANEHSVGTWFAASTARVDPPSPLVTPTGPSTQSLLHINNQTLRQIVHITIGGTRLRVVVSNTFGTAGLRIGAAAIALRDRDAAIVTRTTRPLTFGGAAQMTVPPGAVATSDPVEFAAPDFADLAIDLYLPDDTSAMQSPVTLHPASWQTGYLSTTGNHVGSGAIPVQATTRYRRGDGLESATWFFLTRVEVMAPVDVHAIVAIGDSITDGTASTIDSNNRWPDHLSRRLASGGVRMAVLNAGIGGNRVLAEGIGPAALARFDRDVLSQPGITAVIVLEGINDIGRAGQNPTPSAADLIAGHQQLIDRAHARGLRIFGATLTPFEGASAWTQEGEAKRQHLNEWIRTSGAYDAVFDFEAAVRDPDHPTKTLARFDPGDHLHLNAAGYEAVANTVDLARIAAQGKPPMRLAIAGLVHGHVGAFLKLVQQRSDVQIVGVFESDATLLRSYADTFHIPDNARFTDLKTMIDRTHPEAIAAFTNTRDHPVIVEAAAPRHVHVMMEKPLAVSNEDAQRIRRAAESGGIQVMVNYETTWYPSHGAIWTLIKEQKAVGDIRKMVAMDGHNGPKAINVQPEFLDWLSDPVRNGGGALFDFGCYGANLMTWLMDNQRPIAVTAVTQQFQPKVYPRVDDEATILLEYGTAQGIIQASWNWPVGRKDLEVYGERGLAIATGGTGLRVAMPDQAEHGVTPEPRAPDELDSISHLLAVVRDGRKPNALSSLENNLIVTEILEAARTSARTHTRVALASGRH